MKNNDEHSLWCLETAHLTRKQVTHWCAGGRVPLKTEVDGYHFSWGAIAERQEIGLVIWEFYLEQLTANLGCNEKKLLDIQLALFDSLETRVEHVTRSFVVGNLNLTGQCLEPWRIVPGGLANGIPMAIVCAIQSATQCREWLCSEFVPFMLSDILEEVKCYVFSEQ